jgi:hypothetical protein
MLSQENMEVAACVGFCVWLRNVAKVQMTKINANFLSHFLCHSEHNNNTNTPVLYLGVQENDKTYSEDIQCEEVETCQNMLSRHHVPGCPFISEK